MNTLPELPSDILEAALADLEKAEKTPGFKVNMDVWQAPEWQTESEYICHVCLAGSLMVFTLKTDRSLRLEPDYFSDHQTYCKLKMVNQLRMGRTHDAAFYSEHLQKVQDILPEMNVPFYKHGAAEFKEAIRGMIGKLRELGV